MAISKNVHISTGITCTDMFCYIREYYGVHLLLYIHTCTYHPKLVVEITGKKNRDNLCFLIT